MAQREVVVTGSVRTAIGAYGGSLKDVPPTKLGAIAIKEAVARAKIDPAAVGHVVLGSVIHGEAKDMYFSRVAAIEGGLPVGTPCLTVNRLWGSGLQAIVSAAQHILLGDTDVAIGAGAESMSRAAYFMPAARWGQRMGDAQLLRHQRRRGGGGADGEVRGAEAGREAACAPRGVLARRRGASADGPRADPRGEARLRESGSQARRHGRDRVERGVRGPGDGGDARSRARSGEGQSQRRSGGARPPHWRNRLHPRREGDLRAAPNGKALRPGHDVHRRRAGDRGDFRTDVMG